MLSNRYQYNGKAAISLNTLQLKTKDKYEKLVESGFYTFERVNCAVCNAEEFTVLAEKDRYGLKYHTVLCKHCGLAYVTPRMDQKSYNHFYDNLYRKLYVGSETATTSFFEHQYNRAKPMFDFIHENTPHINFKHLKVLEVGCGAGGILQYFKEQGCIVKGVDLGTEYLEFGIKNHGLDLSSGSLKVVPHNFKPDIIIYSHVMEHILDLRAELQTIKTYCSPDTILFIEVPGIKNLVKASRRDFLQYLQNAHTFHFSLNSLRNLFEQNGFKFHYGNEIVQATFTLSNTESRKISNEHEQTLAYLKRVERFRFVKAFRKQLKDGFKSLFH